MRAQAIQPGTRLGRYQVLELLGVGGMSEVYAGVHLGLRKRVALKVLRPSLRDDSRAVERFLREGECVARVCHPNVVDVDDVGLEHGVPYLAMELLDGETLGARLERAGPLCLRDAADLLLPLIDAVASIHAAGVIHRDIKPGNVVLAFAADGSVCPKLVDFGVATVHERRAITGTVGPVGTPQYMSPEQALGQGALDPASDQYSLASVLFEMLTGHAPFHHDHLPGLLKTVARGDFPATVSPHGELPYAFGALMARATARNPLARFANVHDFGRALAPFASERIRDAFGARLVASGLRQRSATEASVRALALRAPVALDRSPPREQRRWQVASVAIAAAAICGGVFAGTAHTRSEDSLGSGFAPAPAAVSAGGASPIRVWPAEAELALDGQHVVAGGFEAGLGADDALHELRVQADGHVPRLVFFRGALAIREITLEPLR